MKLPLKEAEHEVLRAELAEWDGYVSSVLLGVESIRACARYGREYAHDAGEWLGGMALLPLSDAILDEAASLDPAGLRSLDALHLATALSIRDDIGVFVCYDERLGAAAADRGLNAREPV